MLESSISIRKSMVVERLAHNFACSVASFESNFVAEMLFMASIPLQTMLAVLKLYIGHFCLQFDVTKSHYTLNGCKKRVVVAWLAAQQMLQCHKNL